MIVLLNLLQGELFLSCVVYKHPISTKKSDAESGDPLILCHEGQDLARAMKIYDNIGTTIPYDVLQFQSSISIVYGGNACGVKPTFSKLPRFEVLSVTPQAFELEFWNLEISYSIIMSGLC